MLYPHKEASTPNLPDSYKKKLELDAKTIEDEYLAQANGWLISSNVRLHIDYEGMSHQKHGAVFYYSVSAGKLYSRDVSTILIPVFYGNIFNCGQNIHINAYDVLTCISNYVYTEWFHADDVYEEFGEMKPSKAQGIFDEYLTIKRWLSQFNEHQLEQLAEIN